MISHCLCDTVLPLEVTFLCTFSVSFVKVRRVRPRYSIIVNTTYHCVGYSTRTHHFAVRTSRW